MGILPVQLFDSLRNLVSGLGTAKDPTTAAHYAFCELNREQLTSAYRANWVARRVVDAVPEDATREWRAWQADQKRIEDIEDLEKKYDLQRKTKLALIRARLYGGAALVLGVDGSGETWEPIDLDALKQDCLRFVVVLNRYELSAGQRIYDAESPWYTRPEYYTISTPMSDFSQPGARDEGMVRVHPSRVIEFSGNELPDWRLATLGGGWGDSVLQTLDETLKDFGITMGGIAAMVNDAKVDVIKIPGLATKLATAASTNKLFERFSYANVGKSTLNALLISDDEEWERVTTNFAGLPDIMQQFMTLVSGGAGIPVSRLMGSAPGKGLSTTGGGESDLRNYYDDVASKQKTVYSPAMSLLDSVVQISATGRLDKGVYYNWNPLYQPEPKEVAAIALQKAQATQADVTMGLINEDALRRARVNQLLEDGTYPGLDEAIDEFGEEPSVPTDEEMAQQLTMMGKTLPPHLGGPDPQAQLTGPSSAQDAAPRTLYVRRDVLNADEIIKWARTQGLKETLSASDMHVTIAFSRAPVDWMQASGQDNANDQRNVSGNLTIVPGGARMVDRYGQEQDAVVLLFNSSSLSWRHEELKSKGASWDWPEYQPHVTISYKAPRDLDVSKIDPYRGPIVLGPEIFEEVVDDWKDRIKEEMS